VTASTSTATTTLTRRGAVFNMLRPRLAARSDQPRDRCTERSGGRPQWLQGQRLSPSTLDSYRTNIRLPIDPYLGAQPVARLTGSTVDAWMRKLEVSGRADGQGGLSARTVRYVGGRP
jgi:hypothetical protein